MSGLKFIQKIQELFGLAPETPESKQKRNVKELILKLKLRRIRLKQELKNESDIVKREALKDNLQIIKQQIKKGKKIIER